MNEKILLLIPTLDWGGAEKQALLFAKYLKEKNIQVIIGTFAEEGIVEKKCEENEILCHKIKHNMDFFTIIILCYAKICKVLTKENKYLLREVYDLYREVKREGVTHIVSYCAGPGTIAGVLKKFCSKVKIAWFQRDAGIYNSAPKFQEYAIQHVDYVLANSISGKRWIENNYGREVQVIYNGSAMLETFSDKAEWLRKHGRNENDIIVTMVANLSKAKDHITLLRAWKLVIERKRDKNIILVLAGRYDEEYYMLKRYIEENGLKEYVVFLGLENDIKGLLENTTLFTFSAISEGSSNALIEASLCGLCSVATDLPEIREILSKENEKFLFQRGNYSEYANKILEALVEETIRKEIGYCNKKKAMELFDSKNNFKKILQVIGIEY